MILEACRERERREHNERAWLAHTTAFLTSYHPKEPGKFLALAKLQMKRKAGKPARPRQRRWEDDFAAMQSWTKGRS